MWIDFIEGVTAAEEYLYDDNCNMTKDLNKGISDIQYTVLKLQNIVDGKTIAYCGDSGAYEYNLTDHLGNVRAVVDGAGVVKQKSNYYPFGGVFASTEKSTNKYLYNGKELQEGTGWLDYGARMYSADLGRWMVMDNKAELYMNMSSYCYAANTPTNAIDPDGDIVIFINGMHDGFEGGKNTYWRKADAGGVMTSCFDLNVQYHFNDYKAEYYDGASGGLFGFPENLSPIDRSYRGYVNGKRQAKRIIESLARTNGVIVYK